MNLSDIEKELDTHANPAYKESSKRFHKGEPPRSRGVPTPIVRAISVRHFKKVSKEEVWKFCKALLNIGYSEERTIAFDWAYRIRKEYKASDFKRFESWLENYVTSWGACDDLCTHTLGDFLYQFPAFLPNVRKWAISKKWVMRRAAAVSLIYGLRRGKFLREAFGVADQLLLDPEDLVQKGYGWMLKEATKHHPQEVFLYVMKRKTMPRTALRYAIENLSVSMKKKTLSRTAP